MNLPGLPATARSWQLRAKSGGWLNPKDEGLLWRRRAKRGGGYEFSPQVLPQEARTALVLRHSQYLAGSQERHNAAWRHYETLNEGTQQKAQEMQRIIIAFYALTDNGVPRKKGAQRR